MPNTDADFDAELRRATLSGYAVHAAHLGRSEDLLSKDLTKVDAQLNERADRFESLHREMSTHGAD